MHIAFHAEAAAAVESSDDCFLVCFGEDKPDTDEYLMLQRAFEDDVDDQDIESGMDTYHVELRSQLYGLYGGIEHFVLYRDHVECKFTQAGTARLDGATSARISFDLHDTDFGLLAQRLKDIFRATDCLEIVSG